ncbi:MAG TPA: hypothetical protein VIJ76_08710 [Galbitalea sp.]
MRSAPAQRCQNIDNLGIRKLRLIDGNDLGAAHCKEAVGITEGLCAKAPPRVREDLHVLMAAGANRRENGNLAAKRALVHNHVDQGLGFAGEHRARQ